MSYAVLVDNLRSAAREYRTVAGGVGARSVQLDHVDPASLGHVELAAWLKAVAEQCDHATRALHDGAEGLADSLRCTADHYEATDERIGALFRGPFGGGPFWAEPGSGR